MTLVIYYKIFGEYDCMAYEGVFPIEEVIESMLNMPNVISWRLFP